MKVERISAAVDARHADARRPATLPAAGESLLLRYEGVDGADLIATSSDDVKLRLAGMQRWSVELQPGDVLYARVLASHPMLELELEGAPGRRATNPAATQASLGALTPQAAMRFDQTALLQMAWQAPDAHALAAAWWSLARTRWRTAVAYGDAASAPVTPPLMSSPASGRESASLGAAPLLQAWLLPVYAWGDTHMALALIEPVEPHAARRRPRRPAPSLRLELAPAAVGRIVLLARAAPGGASLWAVVERSESLAWVREAMQLVIPALLRAGVRPAQVRVLGGDERAFGPHRGAAPETRAWFAAQAGSASLFRMLAETAVILLQVLPGRPRR